MSNSFAITTSETLKSVVATCFFNLTSVSFVIMLSCCFLGFEGVTSLLEFKGTALLSLLSEQENNNATISIV